MADPKRSNEPGRPPEIVEIAKWVLGISGIAIFGLSVVSLIGAARLGPPQFDLTSQRIFNALLPLLGTWVGTVLAYYFSRKNFESASQSVERMVTLTAEQKLGVLVVGKEMLRPGQITLYTIAAGKGPSDVPLKDLRDMLGGKITRIPIVDSNGILMYVVHQSSLFKFLAEQALAQKPDVDKLTLQDLVNDAQLKN